jgi:hypothetical protein
MKEGLPHFLLAGIDRVMDGQRVLINNFSWGLHLGD